MSANSKIPFSGGLPIVGHLFGYQRDRLKLLNDLKTTHGSRFRVKVGPKILTVLTSPDDVRHVMQTNMKNYYKRTNFDQLFGQGLFTTNGETWKNQRKMVQPLFGPRYIESCAPIILESAKSALNERLKAEGGGDIYDLYAKATFDIIIKTIIGIDYSDKFKELNFSLNTISDYLTRSNYLPVHLPEALSRKRRVFEECKQVLDSIIFKSIEAQKSADQRKSHSMISLLLQAQEQEPGLAYSDQRVRDNIITLMFAGFETSALTLSWISCLLADMPRLQEELFEEIKTADLSSLKVKDFSDFPLLDAVINEALRLYPPGWAWTRVVKEADAINGHQVEAGEILLISPYLTQRCPDVWKNPDRFDHTRFLNMSPGKHHPFAFFPFGGGPRICVGKQFGMIEIKLILAQVLKDYQFVNGSLPTPDPLATLKSKEGFHVELRKRS